MTAVSSPSDPNASSASEPATTAVKPLSLVSLDFSAGLEPAILIEWVTEQLLQYPGVVPQATTITLNLGDALWSYETLGALLAAFQQHQVQLETVLATHSETRLSARRHHLKVPALPPVSAEAALLRSGDSDWTQTVRHTLRSGQTVESRGHLLIVGDVNAGAEVRAVGDILVWGELKGMAHAGCLGDASAQVAALRLDALQLRIAQAIARRPDQFVAISQADRLARQHTAYAPEVARVEEGEIRIFPFHP